jgi:predicted TPR repeat methyltransferase
LDVHTADVKVHFDTTATYLKDNAIIPLRKRLVREILGDLRGLRILDAGCGDGSISVAFVKHNHVTFLDISTGMLNEVAKAVPVEHSSRAELIQGNFLESHFPQQFDIILCIGILAYIENPDRVLHRVAKLLKPRGRSIFQITDAATLIGRGLHRYARCRQSIAASLNYVAPTRITRQEVLVAASQCGLALVREERYPPTLPGMRYLGQTVCSSFLEWGNRRQLGCELLMELQRVGGQ